MLRSGQLAERIGLSKNTIIDMANRGDIPCYRLPSGHYRFDEQEVIDALRKKAEEGDAESKGEGDDG